MKISYAKTNVRMWTLPQHRWFSSFIFFSCIISVFDPCIVDNVVTGRFLVLKLRIFKRQRKRENLLSGCVCPKHVQSGEESQQRTNRCVAECVKAAKTLNERLPANISSSCVWCTERRTNDACVFCAHRAEISAKPARQIKNEEKKREYEYDTPTKKFSFFSFINGNIVQIAAALIHVNRNLHFDMWPFSRASIWKTINGLSSSSVVVDVPNVRVYVRDPSTTTINSG